MSAARGVMRFVGGKLSKNENAVTLVTPTGTLGIRGGVFLMDLLADGHLDVMFLYGKALTITGNNGVSQTITRPGFAVTIAGPGAVPTPPAPAPPGALGKFLASLGGHVGSTAGARTAPSDSTVAQSGIGSTISGNFTASVQAANQNQPPSAQAQPVNVSSVQSNQQVNTVQSQPQTTTTNTTSGVAVYQFGFWVDAFNDGSITVAPSTGHFASLSNGRLTLFAQTGPFPHKGGTIPVQPGLANFGPPGAVTDSGHPLVGVAYLSPDQSLFLVTATRSETASMFLAATRHSCWGAYQPSTCRLWGPEATAAQRLAESTTMAPPMLPAAPSAPITISAACRAR